MAIQSFNVVFVALCTIIVREFVRSKFMTLFSVCGTSLKTSLLTDSVCCFVSVLVLLHHMLAAAAAANSNNNSNSNKSEMVIVITAT